MRKVYAANLNLNGIIRFKLHNIFFSMSITILLHILLSRKKKLFLTAPFINHFDNYLGKCEV